MNVSLSAHEVAIAKLVGERRQAQGEANGWQPQLGETSATFHIRGALGEIAVAKVLGVYWTGLDVLTVADVGPYHVRYASREDGALPFRPRETNKATFSPDWPLVLVVPAGDVGSSGAELRIAGGTTAGRAMRRPLTDPGDRGFPVWMTPQADLWPLAVHEHRFRRYGGLPGSFDRPPTPPVAA